MNLAPLLAAAQQWVAAHPALPAAAMSTVDEAGGANRVSVVLRSPDVGELTLTLGVYKVRSHRSLAWHTVIKAELMRSWTRVWRPSTRRLVSVESALKLLPAYLAEVEKQWQAMEWGAKQDRELKSRYEQRLEALKAAGLPTSYKYKEAFWGASKDGRAYTVALFGGQWHKAELHYDCPVEALPQCIEHARTVQDALSAHQPFLTGATP